MNPPLRAFLALSAATALTVGLLTVPAAAGGKSWHVLDAAGVKQTRITLNVAQSIDPRISTLRRGTGGEGNIEKCGVVRTQRISQSRHTRWSAAKRKGITLVMQMKRVRGAKSLFRQAREKLTGCSAIDFPSPSRTRATGTYAKDKKELRLKWAIYTDSTRTVTKTANGLAIRRAGAAIIITRSTTNNLKTIKQKTNSKLTSRQVNRYKRAAFF